MARSVVVGDPTWGSDPRNHRAAGPAVAAKHHLLAGQRDLETGAPRSALVKLHEPVAREAGQGRVDCVLPVLPEWPMDCLPPSVPGVAKQVDDPTAKPAICRLEPSRRALCGRGPRTGLGWPAGTHGDAVLGKRAGVAARVTLAADRGADVHQRVCPGGGSIDGDEPVGGRLTLASLGRKRSDGSIEHAPNVRVERRDRPPERDREHRPRRVRPDSRQRHQRVERVRARAPPWTSTIRTRPRAAPPRGGCSRARARRG